MKRKDYRRFKAALILVWCGHVGWYVHGHGVAIPMATDAPAISEYSTLEM